MSRPSRMVRLCAAWLRLQRALGSTASRLSGAASAFWAEALTEEEKYLVTLLAHDRPRHRALTEPLGPLERAWYSRRLPEAPARVLVGGAGAGREAQALVAMGYHVDAFEPSAELVRQLRERLPNESVVLRGSYRNLARSLKDGAGAFAPIASHIYDAFIFGRGSLSHVLQRHERERVLAAACELTPEGPILVSYLRAQDEPADDVMRRAARRMARALRRTSGEGDHRGEHMSARAGFSAPIPDEELEAIATHVLGRDVVWDDREAFPRATLTSRTTSRR